LKRFAEGLSSIDALGTAVAMKDFNQAVPATERADVLTQLWETQGTLGQIGVFNYLLSTTPMVWSPTLAQHLKEAASASDPETRRLAINVWKLRPVAESRAVLIAALDDPLESNRMNAMHAIGVLPERDTLLKEYVKRHASDKDRTNSTRLAQAIVDRKTADKK
jgi:hypothetical protein